MKTGSIPVYARRSSSSTVSHSLERNANFHVNQPSPTTTGSYKLRERSVPRSIGMLTDSSDKLNLTFPNQLLSHDESYKTHNQSNISFNGSKLQTPRSEHKSKLARPKTSTNKQKKEVIDTLSKLPTPSNSNYSKQLDSNNYLLSSSLRTPTNYMAGKENHDLTPKLKVEALNDKNSFVSGMERNNSNTSINSCGFKSRLAKPSAVGSSRPSGVARPKATSKLSRPSSPESVNRSFEDVLGPKNSKPQSQLPSYNSKKKFGSAEGILSPNKESKTMNAMKALMNDVENHFKFRKDSEDPKDLFEVKEKKNYSNFEEEKASGEWNKTEKPRKIGTTNYAEEKTIAGDGRSNLMSPSIGRRYEIISCTKVPTLTSQIPKSKLPSLSSSSCKPSLLHRQCINNTADHSKQSISNESIHDTDDLKNAGLITDETLSQGSGSSFIDDVVGKEMNGLKCEKDHELSSPEPLEVAPSLGDGEHFSAYDIKPMPPLAMSSPYFQLSNLSTGTSPSLSHGSHPNKLLCDPSSVNGDRHFVSALPSSAAIGSFHKSKSNLTNSFDQEYEEMEAGYMSDGDILSSRKTQASSGYTSDGGTFHSGGKQLTSSRLKISDDNYDIFCDENFDGCSSLSSGEDTNSSYSAFANGKVLHSSSAADRSKGFLKSNKCRSENEGFERASRGRSTMPVKGRRAILPLAGFVKKAQEQTANNVPDLEETEIDVKVTYESKLGKLTKSSTASDSIVNEGMVDLDQILNDCSSKMQQINSSKNISQFPSTISEPKDYKFGLSSHPSNFSLMSQYSTGENKPLFNAKKDGVSGSKFGMSLEQCYNSGVFRRRNRSNNINGEDSSNSASEGSERSQTFGKTLSVASDGDQGIPFGGRLLSPSKVNPYATMSRSQMASKVGLKKVGGCSREEANDLLTPMVSRRSEASMCPSEDSASVSSFPCFKLHLPNQFPSYKNLSTSSPAPAPHNLDNPGLDRKICSPNGYMLSRSGSHHASSFSNSRPPSTNGNGSTLSLGSCSSLYSTAEEYHAQEIRRLRHELETAHSRVASLNMQLNINESVVQAFEQSISNLNHRLQQLSLLTAERDPHVRDLKTSLDQFGSFDKNSINFNHTSIPEDCTSLASINQHQELEKKKRQKKWLMSFGKAFFRKKNKITHLENNLIIETGHNEEAQNSNSVREAGHDPVIVLEQKLHEKEMKLTDVQLEALSSAHQLDQLKDSMAQMEKEMVHLRMDNSRLKQLVSQKTTNQQLDKRCSTLSSTSPPVSPSVVNNKHTNSPLTSPVSPDPPSKNSKNRKIIFSVQLTHTNHSDQLAVPETKSSEILFGKLYLTENMGWETLNRSIIKKFQNYLHNVDPEDGLGLDQTSILTLHIGDVSWQLDGPYPPMSPSSYLIGFNKSVSLVLKGVDEDRLDSLAFETMIPRPILERYISLMVEFRRVIFCGPSGTGKTYLALKLAQYMSDRLAKEHVTPTMSVFNVDHKSSKELRQYLSNISSNSSPQNNVIVLDNLHHVVSLADVFNGFISIGNQSSPYVIGTMNQVSSSATNLQLHHMFRWVLYSNHIKPVSGFLGRFLRRHLVEREVLGSESQGVGGELDVENEEELKKTIDWIPKVWQHVNRLLETHNSSEVTLGPQLYLSCPMGGSLMRVWFTDLWNYSVFPYLMEAIKDGIQTYGCRAAWEDPAEWVEKTCPLPTEKSSQLLHLRPEDVGYDTQQQPSDNAAIPFHSNNNNNNLDSMPNIQTPCKVSSDPLLNMLLRLQEFSNNNNNNSKENIISNRDFI